MYIPAGTGGASAASTYAAGVGGDVSLQSGSSDSAGHIAIKGGTSKAGQGGSINLLTGFSKQSESGQIFIETVADKSSSGSIELKYGNSVIGQSEITGNQAWSINFLVPSNSSWGNTILTARFSGNEIYPEDIVVENTDEEIDASNF